MCRMSLVKPKRFGSYQTNLPNEKVAKSSQSPAAGPKPAERKGGTSGSELANPRHCFHSARPHLWDPLMAQDF